VLSFNNLPKTQEWGDRRFGRFALSHTLLVDCPNIVFEIFRTGKIIVVEATSKFATDEIEYVGVSPRFKPVPHGEKIPTYDLIVTLDPHGGVEKIEIAEKRTGSMSLIKPE
jgi:hypothetical protein